MFRLTLLAILTFSFISETRALAHGNQAPGMHWAAIRALDKQTRTAIANEGFSIETVVSDMSYGFGNVEIIASLRKKGFDVVIDFPASEFRASDFPEEDAIYHNYAEMKVELDAIAQEFPGIAHPVSMGKTLEGRDIIGLRINAHAPNGTEPSGLPGIIFMGGHHAREHLSIETPLKLARYLAAGYRDDGVIRSVLENRDVYIFPSINADGSEYDIASGDYKMWRKNRSPNGGNRCAGVDLNRNYSYGWGTGGSSTNACSDVYMGPKAFSEPETQAVKRFVEARPNLKILLSFHTYSELILYPWGGTYDPIPNARDRSAFISMAQTMAGWNGYTPQQSSDLYIASGDTTDWAYGTLGIFAFTFELSPRDAWGGGGFYPGAGAVESTFRANIRPTLYLIDLADDPHRAATRPETTLFYGLK